jgi:hypothetical protein
MNSYRDAQGRLIVTEVVRFTDGTAVKVELDPVRIAEELSGRASRSKRKKATALGGAVLVREYLEHV